MRIGGRDVPRENQQTQLAKVLESLPAHVSSLREFPLGEIQGLSFGIALHPYSLPDVFVRGAGVRFAPLSREHQGARAVLNAVHRLVSSLDQQLESTHLELTLARQQLSDYQHRLGSQFEQEECLTQLTDLRDRLKLALARKVEDGQDPHCVTSELARDIRTMLDSKVGRDATMRPNSNPTVLAEEPVTLQLRRRLDLTQSGSPVLIGRNPEQEQEAYSPGRPAVDNTSSANVPTAPAPIDAPLPSQTYQESVQLLPKRQLQLF